MTAVTDAARDALARARRRDVEELRDGLRSRLAAIPEPAFNEVCFRRALGKERR